MKTRQVILEDLKVSTLDDKAGTIKSVIKRIDFDSHRYIHKVYQLIYLKDKSYNYYFSEESLLIKIATHV